MTNTLVARWSRAVDEHGRVVLQMRWATTSELVQDVAAAA